MGQIGQKMNKSAPLRVCFIGQKIKFIGQIGQIIKLFLIFLIFFVDNAFFICYTVNIKKIQTERKRP